ncbi:MAG: tetratricopeptide repeat protein [Clostridia bacterium]|nr:tetratricopeptide repeat protein [Clostridia bacterium]
MKRIWIFLMTACIILGCHSVFAETNTEAALVPGTVIMFGQYEQDNKIQNGNEPISWVVLDVQDGKALLISQYALDCLTFNESQADLTWADSWIRKWLNNDFFNAAFTDDEQQSIVLTAIHNGSEDGFADYNPVEMDETNDRVFLLSYRETMHYFPEQNDRKVTGTEYARANGARFGGFTTIVIGETDWWLRSPGRVAHDAAFVNVYGNFDTKSNNTKQGIRPAIWVNITTDGSNFPYTRYTMAALLAEQENYAEAVEIYESLGNYNNSPALATYCKYLQAVQASAIGEYNLAIDLFEALNGYEDSYERGRAARYAKAVSYQEAGDYATAAKLFGEVGQYQDSMARMKACFEKQGISMFYFHADAVNAGMDNGYSKSTAIDGGNKHFGWRLGRFFISGFTRVTDNGTDNPIFIKTLGDSVTLWFDLEQNISALNGNTNLVINEDINGFDQYFGIQKTNFGKGALVIRHTNYQNAKGDPILYTDYLLAKGTTGADTKVVLNEEGDYEVALNYELQDNDITHITSKFDNYRIFFKFSIRNGNCMVYPFDVVTRVELQNTAITENGFYLDLARSRYLDIDVKRSVIIEGPNGIVEDERFNRPAKDGDQYMQEGIYTISVINRYTGESTVKTIFVGSDELLQHYISNGFNMDRLK